MTGRSCFSAACPSNGTATSTWTKFPATSPYQRIVIADQASVFGLMQTQSLDLIAFNLSTGVVLWTTYPTEDAGAVGPRGVGGSRAAEWGYTMKMRARAYLGLPLMRDATSDLPFSSSSPSPSKDTLFDAGATTPLDGPVLREAVVPDYLVSAAIDAAAGLIYVQDTDVLHAISSVDGTEVWSIGLDGEWLKDPLWTGVAGSGRTMLVVVPPTSSASTAAAADVSKQKDGAARTNLRSDNVQPAMSDVAAPPPPFVLVKVDVFSPLRGVVATNWLVRVEVGDAPQVTWAAPVAYMGTTRAACAWPPLISQDGTAVFITCDTVALGMITQNTTMIAMSLVDGSQLWNVTLDRPGFTLGSTLLPYFTPPVVLPTASLPGRSTIYVGSNQPGSPGVWVCTVDTVNSNRLVSSTFLSAPASGPGSGGWQGSLITWPSPNGGPGMLLVGFTADGSVAAWDPSSSAAAPDAPSSAASIAYTWSQPLSLPPISTRANYGQYQLSPAAPDASTHALWWTWSNVNGSGGLVGICAPTPGMAYPSIGFAGWPSDAPTLGSFGWTTFDLPLLLPQASSSSVSRLMIAGRPNVPTVLDFDVTAMCGGGRSVNGGRAADVPSSSPGFDGQAASAAVDEQSHAHDVSSPSPYSVAWTLPAPGPVMGTPCLVTDPRNSSRGLLVYSGWRDDIIYAVDPGVVVPSSSATSPTQPTAAAVWSNDPNTPDGSLVPGGCVGVWTADLLVCLGGYGSITMLQLSTGVVTATLAWQDFWKTDAACGTAPLPCWGQGMVLVDDASSPIGYSIVLLMSEVQSGVLTLIRLPDPSKGLPPPSPVPLMVWQADAGSSSTGNPFGFSGNFLVTETSVNTGNGGAPGMIFTTRSYYDIVCYSLTNGSMIWSSRASWPPPPTTNAWRASSFAYDATTSVLYAAMVSATFHIDEEQGYIAAVKAADGSLLWRTPDLCIIPRNGIMVQPGSASSSASPTAFIHVTCSNAGPADQPGKVLVVSAVDGSVVGWYGQADGGMVSGPTLVNVPAATGGGNGSITLGASFGATGGVIVVANTTSPLTSGTAASPAPLPLLTSLSLPWAAGPIEWSYLNAYPSFIFTSVSDASGMLYAAGGDDRHLYRIAAPGVAACGSGPAPLPSASPVPLPSSSPAPTAVPSASPAPDNGLPSSTVATISASVSITVIVAAAGFAFMRVRGRAAFGGAPSAYASVAADDAVDHPSSSPPSSGRTAWMAAGIRLGTKQAASLSRSFDSGSAAADGTGRREQLLSSSS